MIHRTYYTIESKSEDEGCCWSKQGFAVVYADVHRNVWELANDDVIFLERTPKDSVADEVWPAGLLVWMITYFFDYRKALELESIVFSCTSSSVGS